MKKKPLILVTNDDGINAPGIRALVEIAKELGDVVVVAPDSPQSGQGHAVTLHHPIWLRKVDVFAGIEAYECSGTPVDCVKLAKHEVLKGRTADLCVSGINHGSNASINILYSGTMSAAMEASLEGINSIGFSHVSYDFNINFEGGRKYVKGLMEQVLTHGLKGTKLLNVNIPKGDEGDIKGVRVCRQAEARWVEDFMINSDPRGRKYYWMTGVFINQDHHKDTDIWALSNGYISVVPCGHDLTAYEALEPLRYLETSVLISEF